jgi:hypothetical protein
MSTPNCSACGEAIEHGYTMCWRCGTHLDGSPPDKDFVPDQAAAPPRHAAKPRDLACLRCGTPMAAVSRMRFHEGTRAWPFLLGELGELFVNRETFDTYACTGCGKVEFFVTE